MRWRAFVPTMFLCGGLLVARDLYAQPPKSDPWFSLSNRPKDFQRPTFPLGGFSIELPKDWQLSPGFNTFLIIASEKTKNNQLGASLVVEQWQLANALAVNEASATYVLEEFLKKREPGVQEFTQEVREVDGRKFFLTRYTRAGVLRNYAVVDYSIPIGTVLYRLMGIAPADQVTKYQPVFAHVAFTLKPEG